jgi:hypothetical protein
MEWLLFYTVMVIAVGGISLMLTAFVLAAGRGGWQRAMQPDGRGRWPLPRLLLLAGAALVTLFGLLLFVPGAVPYWDISSPGMAWMMGAVFGFSVSMLSHRVSQALRRGGETEAPGQRA